MIPVVVGQQQRRSAGRLGHPRTDADDPRARRRAGSIAPVRSSMISMHGVLQPCPMPLGTAHGTDPLTPLKRTRIAADDTRSFPVVTVRCCRRRWQPRGRSGDRRGCVAPDAGPAARPLSGHRRASSSAMAGSSSDEASRGAEQLHEPQLVVRERPARSR